jgi:methyl-accepting chemotaxis protein
MKQLADGKTDFPIVGTDRRDEIGDMAEAMETFVANENMRRDLEDQQTNRQEHRSPAVAGNPEPIVRF